jgi:hypothetical protein
VQVIWVEDWFHELVGMLVPPKDIFVIGDGNEPNIVRVVPAEAVVGDKELTEES